MKSTEYLEIEKTSNDRNDGYVITAILVFIVSSVIAYLGSIIF